MAQVTITEFIKTDQFGYRTNDEKVAVISDPQTGYNSASSFSPCATYEVRALMKWVSPEVLEDK